MGWLKKIFGIKDKVMPTSINDSNFKKEVIQSDLPVLLDVWTPNCPHCDRLAPIVVNLATKYQGRLKVAEINGADSPRTMSRLGVRGTPTVIYFIDGHEVERVVGFRGSLYHTDIIENDILPAVEPPEGEEGEEDARVAANAS